jgi:phospholipase/lecithinase/hemolysin
VSTAIERLYDLAARHIMVLNMANLGLAPVVPAPLKNLLNQVAQLHNAKLAAALAQLSNKPGIRIIPIDVHSHLESLVQNSAFNFQEPAAQPFAAAVCLFNNAFPPPPDSGSDCPNVTTFNVNPKYFFWDVQHPTTAAHANVAAFMHRELKRYFAR